MPNGNGIQIEGRQYRIARLLAGYKQRDLADLMKVQRQRISEWETGARGPTASQVEALTKLLSKTLPLARTVVS